MFPWPGIRGRRLQLPCQRGKSGSVLDFKATGSIDVTSPSNAEQGGQSSSAGTGTRSADAAQIFCQTLPPSGCCPCCTWKNKSLHNKTHAHPRPRHTPAGPEPSTASPTKLLEGFCPPWSNWGVYLSCSQPAQADVLLQNEFPHISHPFLCSWNVQS